MSNIKNIKRSIVNIITATASTASVLTQVLADGTEVGAKSIASSPAVLKELMQVPFSATEGVLIDQGMDEDKAHKKAYKYVNQDVATSIREGSVGSGKMLNKLWASMSEED